MINQYPAWKYTLIAVALLAGVVFALPQLFGEAPAVQVSPVRGASIDQALLDRLIGRVEAEGIVVREAAISDRLLIGSQPGKTSSRPGTSSKKRSIASMSSRSTLRPRPRAGSPVWARCRCIWVSICAAACTS